MENTYATDEALENTWRRYTYGVYLRETYSGVANQVTFKAPVDTKVTSQLTRQLVGLGVHSFGSGLENDGTRVRFESDAVFDAVAHKGGTTFGADFYVNGWNNLEGATETQKANQHFFFESAADTTITLKAAIDHTSEAGSTGTRSKVTGLRHWSFTGMKSHYAIDGKLDMDVVGDHTSYTVGMNLILKDSSLDGHIHELFMKASNSGNTAPVYGIWTNASNASSVDLSFGKTDLTLTSEGDIEGITFSVADTSSVKLHMTDDLKLSAQAEQEAYGFNLVHAASDLSIEADKATHLTVRGQLTDARNQPTNTSAIYSYLEPSEGQSATSKATFQDLTIDTAGYGMYAWNKARGTTEIKVNGAYRLLHQEEESQVPMVFAVAEGGGVTDIQFHGAMNAQHDTLFYVMGEGSKVTVDSPAAQLEGTAGARDGGVLSLRFSSDQSNAHLMLTNFDAPATRGARAADPGTVTVEVAQGATWTVVGPTSHIDELTFATQGVVDLTNGLGDDGEGTLGQRFLRTKKLLGDNGLIRLKANTETEVAQQLHIANSSQGNHKIDVKNSPEERATGKPILLVVSEDGLTNDAAFEATFEAEHPVEMGELLYYTVGRPETANAAADALTELSEEERNARKVNDPNRHNWYLFAGKAPAEEPTPKPDPDPQPESFTNAARGQFANGLVHYLAATREETLRERVGDVHTFMKREEGTLTPWVMIRGEDWRATNLTGIDRLHLKFKETKVGVDKAINPTHRLGVYFGYSDIDSSGMNPLDLSGRNLEVGATWTALSEKGTYLDAKVRLGRTESKFSTLDSVKASVTAKRNHSNYVGASVEVGRWLDVTESVNVQPMAQAVLTHMSGFNATTSAGLRSHTESLTSLLTRVGGMVDARFAKASAHPWTVYGKAYWEREWLAKPELTFNEANTYDLRVRGSRLVYGLGLEGTVGKASSWHVDVERSTGSRLREDWQVNAGLRIPF